MTNEQYQNCLICLNRNPLSYKKSEICNLRNKNIDFSGKCSDFDMDNKVFKTNYNVFEIYETNNKKIITNDTIFIIVAILFIIILYSSKKFDSNISIQFFVNFSKFVVLGLLFIGLYQSIFSKKKIQADYKGEIKLLIDGIIIADNKYTINRIEEIIFNISDYANKKIMDDFYSFNRTLSNGTANYFELYLKNGDIIKYRFKLSEKDDFLKNRIILVEYYKKGIISSVQLKKILKLDKLIDNEKFVKEIN